MASYETTFLGLGAHYRRQSTTSKYLLPSSKHREFFKLIRIIPFNYS